MLNLFGEQKHVLVIKIKIKWRNLKNQSKCLFTDWHKLLSVTLFLQNLHCAFSAFVLALTTTCNFQFRFLNLFQKDWFKSSNNVITYYCTSYPRKSSEIKWPATQEKKKKSTVVWNQCIEKHLIDDRNCKWRNCKCKYGRLFFGFFTIC